MIYIVIGVSGSGKSAFGKLLSKHLHIPFYDADDFHPKENIIKMADGQPLTDADRQPWLEILARKIQQWHQAGSAVLACSALKEDYRQTLHSLPAKWLTWIVLNGDKELLTKRLAQREYHFFNPVLLDSQLETFESPRYGIHLDIRNSLEDNLDRLMHADNKYSQLGLIGLGVMGRSLARNIAGKGYKLSVYNRQIPGKEVDVAKGFVEEYPDLRLEGHDDLDQFIGSLVRPRIVILMVNAGKPIDELIETIAPKLDVGDVIIDGGNSHYKDSSRRTKKMAELSIDFLGIGISGGEEGALKGPSIMPGGNPAAYEKVSLVLEAIAACDKDKLPCCTYIGPDGAGHFAKMVHNGIEYAEMQILAEVYFFMRYHMNYSLKEIRKEMRRWQESSSASYLLEITIEILNTYDGHTPLLDLVLDRASNKGTGSWALEAAAEIGAPLSTISEALMARFISVGKHLRLAAAGLYSKNTTATTELAPERIQQAYDMARIINHAIGFQLLQMASEKYSWQLNLKEVARIWTNGCIIKSILMEDFSATDLGAGENVLLNEQFLARVKKLHPDLRSFVSTAISVDCPVPVMSAALNYFNQLCTANSSANLIQAQRDYFGAHKFARVDHNPNELFHWRWR